MAFLLENLDSSDVLIYKLYEGILVKYLFAFNWRNLVLDNSKTLYILSCLLI